MEQTTPVTSLAEKVIEIPVIRTQEKTQQLVNTFVQHVVNAVEVEKSEIIEETVQRTKLVIQEKINQEIKRIEIPLLQFMNKVVDIPCRGAETDFRGDRCPCCVGCAGPTCASREEDS